MVSDLDPAMERGLRLVELLGMALTDCLESVPGQDTKEIPLLVALEETGRPDGDAELVKTIVANVSEKLSVSFHAKLSRVITKGHIGGFEALRIARELTEDSEIPGCLVCGVDSYINKAVIDWLDQHWRLKHEDNSNGVIPGEAAAAVFVSRKALPQMETKIRVAGLGFGEEQANVLSEEPLLGLGLTAAARTALAEANLKMNEIDLRLSDVTGESYGFKEHTLMLCRVMREGREELPIWHCADSIGDTGAAAGVCQLVIAHDAFTKGYAPGNNAACYTSSVFGDRASAVLRCQRNNN